MPSDVSGYDEVAKAVEDEFLGDGSAPTIVRPTGSFHILPFKASSETRYGPCHVVSYSTGEAREVMLQWQPEIKWKRGERQSKSIGAVDALDPKSLKFTLSAQMFEKLRADDRSIPKEKVRLPSFKSFYSCISRER